MVKTERIRWVKDRIWPMGCAEIISRLADVGRHVILYALLKGVRWQSQNINDNSDPLLRVPGLNGRLEGLDPEVQERVLADAGRWLNHRASFFGVGDKWLGEQIDWHCDYSSGVIGRRIYSGLIDPRNREEAGNIRYIWELNRLQHLVSLALAWLSTGNGAYRQEIERQLVSWNAKNPFMTGVNWKSPLEAGIRLISWAYVFFLTAGVNGGKERYQKALQETIYQHQYFIRKFYSKHSSANNHLIGEMAGLYVASVFWPWYKESASWRSFAWNKLIEEIARQVEADGVGKERATEYQLFILEFFLLAGALGQAIGEPFPQEYWGRLNRMVAFLSAISDRSGNLPMFGDGDSGQVVWLPETTQERARSLIRLGQLREAAKGQPDLRSMLLLWGQKQEQIPLKPISSSGPRPDQSLQAFPQGGYYVLATDRGDENEMLVVFDAGPLGLAPLYAHGHADALSFWLSYGGHELFIDPGTFCYHTDTVWRSYFRGTAAHNTARIDGEDQSLAGGGPFLWRHVAQGRAEHCEDNAEFVEAEGFHDGYRRLSDPVVHRRKLRLYKNSRTLLITDRFQCVGTHDVELFFHFNEKCQVRQIGPESFQISNGQRLLILRFLGTRLKTELYRGSESPIFGWVSRTFDVKEPCFTLAARARIDGLTEFLTEISPA